MTQQTALPIRVAPSAVAITATYDWRSGWGVRFAWRASGDPGWCTRSYELLSGPELVDVLAAELEQLVNPSRESTTAAGAAVE